MTASTMDRDIAVSVETHPPGGGKKARAMSPALAGRLAYVCAADPNLDLSAFPDFFLIGPQRTASSWLYGLLRRHPQILMSFPKETGFFVRRPPPGDGATSGPAPVRRHELAWYLDLFRDSEERAAARREQCLTDFGLAYAPVLRGEASATYAAGITPAALGDAVLLNPDLKAITLVRHPVDRAWSHLKLELGRLRGRPVSEIPQQEIVTLARSLYLVRCGRYGDHQAMWRSYLKPGRFFVAPFDDLVRRPDELMRRVCRFLGVDDTLPLGVTATVDLYNRTEATTVVPEPYRTLLYEMFQDEITRQRDALNVDWS
jgi:hypothetical protein